MKPKKILASQKPPYIIYKINVVGTKYYYIGVTGDLSVRKHHHLLRIASAIQTLKFNKEVDSNQFYAVVAEMLYHTTTEDQFWKQHYYQHASNNLTFKKVKSCYTLEEAREIEGEHIKNSRYCLNLQKTSYYGHKIA